MSRLYAFGDSLTYGFALDDIKHWPDPKIEYQVPTYDPYKSYASKYAWPTHVAKSINKEYYNFGTPGSSNKEIAWRFQHMLPKIKQNDIVCFLWSYIERHVILKEEFEETLDAKHGRTKNGPNKKLEKAYSKVEDYYDYNINSIMMVSLTHYACQSIGAKSYHMLQDWTPAVSGPLRDPLPSDINLIDGSLWHRNYIDRAHDGKHPGPIEQRNIAKRFIDIINKTKDIK